MGYWPRVRRKRRHKTSEVGLHVAPRPTITPDVALGPGRSLPMPQAFSQLAAPPVFITGQARSGTSWTLDLFDRQPEVCAVFETWLLTQTHGVTAVLTQPQWHPEFRARRLGALGTPQAVAQLVDYEQAAKDLGELVAGWLMRAVKPEHRYLVEKSPLDIPATATLIPEARFVHVIRDGRDVALSVSAASRSWARSMGRFGLSQRAIEWRTTIGGIRSHREALGDRYWEIRFEDLNESFDDTVRGLFEFAGVPAGEDAIRRARAQTTLTSYSEGARRSGFRGGGGAGGWRERFSIRDAIAFDRSAGSMLIELGYEKDRSWVWRQLPRPMRGGRP